MPEKVEELIESINSGSESENITCVLADQSIGWALDVAEKIVISRAAFCPAAAAMLVLGLSIPNLIDNGITDKDGNFWPQDVTCLKWLDEQSPRSVIYVAFGSFTTFDTRQFQELCLGLELCNRPFLWVVQPDIKEGIKHAYPEGFEERIGLGLEHDGSGIITQGEIRSKIEQLLNDKYLKARATSLKEKIQISTREGGLSNKSLDDFIRWIKS
ncbi:unnamed protein product [Lupinus luteus]|uniref:Uncharacterized protein n=1 Tax=Lupinus luteus TaxID=3873 RepID=A0AAV1VQB5_LUPLU